MGTKNGTLGGGEILQYQGGTTKDSFRYMDKSMMQQLAALPYLKFIIAALLILIMLIVIFKLLRINSPFKGRALTNELEHMDEVRKRDAAILKANKLLASITNVVEHSPFAIDTFNKEYLTYNLERVNIRTPGGTRFLKAEEWNAIIRCTQFLSIIFGIVIVILISPMAGTVLAMGAVMLLNTLPLMTLRAKVADKDNEITENFADFYLMIHYTLMARANTPLSGIIKSFDKTTSSEEMHRFANICINLFDTYGEYEGTDKVRERYKEIPQVCKLMRLIKQANNGGDVTPELKGFRAELLEAKENAIEMKRDKLIGKARRSFYILWPILIQAIISAMAIYADDLALSGSLF